MRVRFLSFSSQVRLIAAFVCVGWIHFGAGHALAQPSALSSPEEQVAPEEPKPEVVPPRLSFRVEPSYPEKALRAGVEGRVILVLSISSQGEVTEAEVLEEPGGGLGEAARAAALRFVFTPASVDGVNKAARIRFAYDFVLPPVEAVEDPDSRSASPVDEVPATSAELKRDVEQETAEEEPAEEVVVRGLRAADRKQRSAEAVTVVDLRRAKRESADLAEVLARVEGVNVQRMGGLGSEARFSLAGFDDTQIRFFIDGVPLEYQGFSLGLQNVPLGFAERIDVYKGVVPVKLGADSLGGAFDLVTDRRTSGTRVVGSYQGGSFDTHRMMGAARHLDERTGFFLKTEAFYDTTQNDYPVEVPVPDTNGESQLTTVRRFHDAYGAHGANLEAGFVNQKWASRLLLKGFINTYNKEIQHNPLMTNAFADAAFGGVSRGLNLRYEHYFGQGLSGTFVSGYVFDRTDFVDDTDCFYDWFGNCTFESFAPRAEVVEEPTDQQVWDHTGFARWNFDWQIAPEHKIVMATAPTYFTRRGDNELRPGESNFDPLRADREMFKWINGVDYQTQLLRDRVENRFFVKNYLLLSDSEETLGEPRKTAQELFWGVGNGVRFSLNDWALIKAAYEYAVRIPEPREIFGNSVNVIENLELKPERSHNVNLSFMVADAETSSGLYNGVVTGFFRKAEDLILLVGRTDVFSYENAFQARVFGVEGATSWLAPGDFLELGLNATYQEYRNDSDEGPFAQFKGDRIPNKPYLFGNATARLLWQSFAADKDELSLSWYSRYTHEFLRFWESVGTSTNTRPEIPHQLVHSAVLNYLVNGTLGRELSFSAEAQNLTNEQVFDFYRVQKPGRAFYGKVNITY